MTSNTRSLARALLADDPLFFDTETTGLDSSAEICDIAIVDAAGQVLLNTLVRPTCAIPLEASAVHGITDADVAGAPTITAIWPELAALLAGPRPLVAYNAGFDRRMITQSCAARGLYIVNTDKALEEHLHCAMLLYAEHWGDWNYYKRSWRWQSLGVALSQQGIQIDGLHRALADAEAARRIVMAMAGQPEGRPAALAEVR